MKCGRSPLLLPLLLLGACATGPRTHLGRVTAIARVGERTFSCSQAGVFAGEGADLRLFVDPGWRPLAVVGCRTADQDSWLLLVGGGMPAVSGELLLVQLTGRVVASQRIADDLVYAVAVTPTGDLAAAACADGRVQLFDLPELGRARVPWRHDGPAVAVAFSPDGSQLASGGTDGKILLGDITGDTAPRALLDHTGQVTCLAWSDDMVLASGASDGKVRLHDRSGRLLHTWQRLGGAVRRVRFRSGRFECEVERGPDRAVDVIVLDSP